MCPKILQEFQILDVERMVFGGCANAVIEADLLGISFSRGASLYSSRVALIAVAHGHR